MALLLSFVFDWSSINRSTTTTATATAGLSVQSSARWWRRITRCRWLGAYLPLRWHGCRHTLKATASVALCTHVWSIARWRVALLTFALILTKWNVSLSCTLIKVPPAVWAINIVYCTINSFYNNTFKKKYYKKLNQPDGTAEYSNFGNGPPLAWASVMSRACLTDFINSLCFSRQWVFGGLFKLMYMKM